MNVDRERLMWGELIRDSFLRPRVAARRVLAIDLSMSFLLQAAVLVTIVGMVLGFAAFRVAPEAIDQVSATVLSSPLAGALMQLAAMVVVVFLAARVGRLFGGTGRLRGALALVVWLNAMMVLLQAVQLVALMVLPAMAAAVAIMSIVWVLYAFASFVAELHGFRNAAVVLAGVLATSVVLMLGAAMLAAILGFVPQEIS